MSSTADLAFEVISHHLRLFGVDDAGIDTRNTTPARLLLLAAPKVDDVGLTQAFSAGGGIAIAALPNADFCGAFGVEQSTAVTTVPAILAYQPESRVPWARLRTLHAYHTFHQASGSAILSDQLTEFVWLWLPVKSGGVLFVGTDLAGDIIRYRQGDPAKETARPTEASWGIAGERPNYLFEEQLKGEPPQERHADWWAIALARFLSDKLGKPLLPLLPGGVPGAVIITGDDDQAQLEKYAEQLTLLERTPITYFLHPLTKHTQETSRSILGKPWIDLGIHPDALDAPDQYDERLAEQVRWYRSLVGRAPVSLRNHGFLNDGYWRHLPPWLENGIRISSNLPGLDGRVLNGSLLPARLARDEILTPHWSVLTAIGDGVRFISGMTETDSAKCVYALADSIRQSSVPGIMVLNLHPQNVGETRAMHEAAMEVIKSGFHPWTIQQCLEWFELRDGAGRAAMQICTNTSPLRRMWNRVRSNLIS